jgi:hypothetical protein
VTLRGDEMNKRTSITVEVYITLVELYIINAGLPFTVTALAHGFGSTKGDLIPQDMLLDS